MINPFASLGMKIMGGLQVLSLIAIVFLLLAKAGETRRADKLQVRLTETNAKLEIQNDAVDDLKADGERRKKAAEDALQRAKQGTARAEAVARQIEAPAPLSGRCETPKAVLSAEL